MNSPLVQKLTGVRDLKRILETTVKELGDQFSADACQIILSNPLDHNVTSICEYRSTGNPVVGKSTSLPLVLEGASFGSLTVSRSVEVTPDEMNVMRVILGELGYIIRLAQINDVVQRDTFRDTFLVEIGNLMTYSLGIGDALFMVVNILGKALAVSRCLFICTDDTAAGWKCFEFWQQDRVESLRQCCWPSADSALVAQTLLAREPLKMFEGQQNSYVSPAQEELQLISAKSLLGIPLRSSQGTHGCVIMQQCDYRRAWTRNEIDMVQNVADKVAEALLKLPAEKKAREPIMQLHQRIVSAQVSDAPTSAIDVRRALKGAMGQQAIPQASRGGPPPAPAPAKAPAAKAPPAPAAPVVPAGKQPAVLPGSPASTLPPAPMPPKPAAAGSQADTSGTVPRFDAPASSAANRAAAEMQRQDVTGDYPIQPAARPPVPSIAEQVKLQQTTGEFPGAAQPTIRAVVPPGEHDPYADLDFGDLEDVGIAPPVAPVISAVTPQVAAVTAPPPADESPDVWAGPGEVTDFSPGAVVSATTAPAPAAPVAVTTPSVPASPPAPAPAPVSAPVPVPAPAPVPAAAAQDWGNLDSIPTPKGGAPAEKGALDAIPTPPSAAGRGGLGASMFGKARGAAASGPLKSRLGQTAPPPAVASPPPPPAEPAVEVDEATAKKKLDQIMSSSANDTSDYIFATPGLDARMLGRIDGWVSQIHNNDKYAVPHAKAVAEYALAIAREMGITGGELDTIRQAALVHDLGKLGSPAQILQKGEDELSDAELLSVMNHPMEGALLLESFPDLKHLAPIVRAHHEEFDGNGYPLGLKGDEIPVAARIIGLANRYHELVAPRRSGPGLDPIKAQTELVELAGKSYDPTTVQSLMQALLTGKVPGVM